MLAPEPEFATRLARVQASMADASLSALVVSDPANIYYLCGYDAWSFYVPQCVIVPAEGGPAVLWPGDGRGRGSCHLGGSTPTECTDTPSDLVHHPDEHPFDWIADRARTLGLFADEPGPVRWRWRPTLTSSPLSFLPRAARSTTEDLRGRQPRTRQLGSAGEERLRGRTPTGGRQHCGARHARGARGGCRWTSPVRRRRRDRGRPGDRHTRGDGGDYTAIVPMLPTGHAAGTPHLTWSDAPFVSGEATTVELAGCLRALSRTARPHDHAGVRRPRGWQGQQLNRQPKGMSARPGRVRSGGHWPRCARSLQRSDRTRRADQGVPDRLLDRDRLPARLGRAHRQPTTQGGDRARPRDGVPHHLGACGWTGGDMSSPSPSSSPNPAPALWPTCPMSSP